MHWWAGAYFWISCLHDSYWLFSHVNTNKSELPYDTVIGDRCHKILFSFSTHHCYFFLSVCKVPAMWPDWILTWANTGSPADGSNVNLSQMCHQVYEQQIANLKNMSPAIQINPINPNFHLLTAHRSGLPSCGIYFLACLFSDSVKTNTSMDMEAFLGSLDQRKHIVQVRRVWAKQMTSFWKFYQWP